MFWEILLAIIVGVHLGTLTGLTPGLHVNLVAVILLLLSSGILEFIGPFSLVAGIMAMSMVHVLMEYIPAVFLGAPSDTNVLAVLPGHQLLLKGRGYEAVVLSCIGGFAGILLLIAALPVLIVSVSFIFQLVKPYIGYVLLAFLIYAPIREKQPGKSAWSIVVILLSGFLGYLTLNVLSLNQPLMPLLAGLFGVSTLVVATLNNSAIPIQVATVDAIPISSVFKSAIAGSFSGGLISIFPALGPAQASMFALELVRKSPKSYLITIGAVGTTSMLFGLVTLLAIDKARNGSIAILSEIEKIQLHEFIMLIIVSVISCGIAVIITIKMARIVSKNIYRIRYNKISIAVIAFITLTSVWLSHFLGLVVLMTGTAIGILAITKNIARHTMMASLMVPVMLFYF